MRKNNIFLEMKYFLAIFAALAFVFGAGQASALTKSIGDLEISYNDPLFDVKNAAPGQEFSSTVTVKNNDGKPNKLQFEISAETTPKGLAELLYFKIKDSGGNELFGYDRNYSLSELDKAEVKIENIPTGDERTYNFIIVFDAAAGNEYQNASTTFDMRVGFEEVLGDGGGDGGGDGDGGAVVTTAAGLFAGFPAGGVVAGEQVPGEEVQPGEVKGEEAAPGEGEVMGEEISLCQGWPKWVWVLMLIAYFAAFLWRTFEKIKEQIEKRDIRWKWQAALAAAAFLVWYFFDKCREYRWFVILAMVGGAAIYLAYLYLFKKHIRETQGKIESGSGQKPPENPAQQ